MKIFFGLYTKSLRGVSEEHAIKVRELLQKMNKNSDRPVMSASFGDMKVVNYGEGIGIPIGKKLSFRVDAETGEIFPPISDANFNTVGKTIDTISSHYDKPEVKKPYCIAFNHNVDFLIPYCY